MKTSHVVIMAFVVLVLGLIALGQPGLGKAVLVVGISYGILWVIFS